MTDIRLLDGAVPVTGPPPSDRVPDIIGIGRGDTANYMVRVLGGKAVQGDVTTIEMKPTEAVISPANTKGYMGGKVKDANIDAACLDMFGAQIQDRVQARIKELYGSDSMPLGDAFMIRTYPEGVPVSRGKPGWLIVAPTIVLQATGAPRATPDLAGKALEAALIVAGVAGMSAVYVPAMGMGSTVGSENMRGEFQRAFGDAYDDADEYLYDRYGDHS